jgi:hypothetical protein
MAERSTATWWSYSAGTPDRAVADWVVSGTPGTTISVKVGHDRAGVAEGEVALRTRE